jgi:hypothetical protein
MTARVSLPFPPRLMGEPQAAAYLGVSATTLRGLGLARVQLGARRLYDRLDLDAYADALPRDGESVGEANSCDAVWGKAQ